MSLSSRTKNALSQSLCDSFAASEIASLSGAQGLTPTMTTVTTTGAATFGGAVTHSSTSHFVGAVTADAAVSVGGDLSLASGKVLKVNSVQVVGAQQTAAAALTVTFTSGGTPTLYTTPTTTLTISDSSTPTVVELMNYCNQLRGRITAINTILHAHGLTT